MRLPLSSMISAPLSWRSTAATVSPRRKITPRSRSESCSARTISESQNGSSSRRVSTTVTFVPTAANIDAYSMPITPAPTTTSVCGICLRLRMPSESRIDSSSNSMLGGRTGRLPVAITMRSASTTWRRPSAAVITTVSLSTKLATPSKTVTRLRPS